LEPHKLLLVATKQKATKMATLAFRWQRALIN